jgi:hypothetical protein
MINRLANVLYWAFSGAAGLVLLGTAYGLYVEGLKGDSLLLAAIAVFGAGLLWLVGRAFRYVWRGEKSSMPNAFSREHVLAQWAYSELLGEHGPGYQTKVPQELVQKARRGVPFDQLGQEELRRLLDGWCAVRGVLMLTAPLKGISKFELKSWNKGDLAAVQIVPYFAREIVGDNSVTVRFDNWMDTEPIEPLPASHPRCAAVAPPSPQADPITVGRHADGTLVLIDGYHRAGRSGEAPTLTRRSSRMYRCRLLLGMVRREAEEDWGKRR